MRSEPGQGRPVEVHHLQEPLHLSDAPGRLSWHSSHDLQEDYADTDSPLVVKISPYYSRAEAARQLRTLADSVERWTPWAEPSCLPEGQIPF
jgi:hypothetical protein